MNMVPSSATAISMEGNKLWIMKVAPVATEKILLTKVITNILLCTPTIIINTVLGVVLWGCGIVDAIFLILVPLVAVAAMSALSLWINTHKYRLDWVNPTQLKQGTETLISMLLSYLLDILLIAPSIILTIVFGIYGPAIALIIVVVEACITFAILFTNGKKRYDSIEI